MNYELVLGITTKCNAKCKICARNIPTFNEGVNLNYELNLELLKPHLHNFKSLIFVGGYGEAVLHSKFLPFLDYVNEHYPNMYLMTSSNMGIQPVTFWEELATKNIKLIANIDGIGELNEIYRGSNYNVCLRNLKAYINAGGPAIWSTIAFNYNKHQFDQLEQLAKEIGCNGFRIRRSDRYYENTPLYLDNELGRKPLCNINIDADLDVYCEWKDTKKIFLNEFGIFCPCCHSDPNYANVRSDKYLSLFFKENNTSINNKFKNIISILDEKVYSKKENIELCNALCKIPPQIKESTIYFRNINF